MILNIDISDKTIGPKHLFSGLAFGVEAREKVAIIGRNGVGKTTLFNMLSGDDGQFKGKIAQQRGLRMAVTKQEFHNLGAETCLEYIRDNLPEYRKLHHILESYPSLMGSDHRKIAVYSEALERFSSLGYYHIEDKIITALEAYQITREQAQTRFGDMSGGQKRFAELVRVELADADLALIDEPTNHMDYVGKEAFITWLKDATHAIAVITHDRDVLGAVDRIIELKDRKAFSFPGDYDAYLKQNGLTTVSQISDYENAERTLDNLGKQIVAAKTKKLAASSDSASRFRIMEDRLRRQYKELEANTEKPSFWIDQETVSQMPGKVADRYHRYKAQNVKIRASDSAGAARELLTIQDLSLGYAQPLFSELSFTLGDGDRVEIKGRNGAGKTTLVKAVLDASNGHLSKTILEGKITVDPKLRLGYYEQEVSDRYLTMTLGEAITLAYNEKNSPINDQLVRRILSDYLFDAEVDAKSLVGKLSGGQKARLQIIRMLSGQPNLLILDEPTNHLDLPSIEELDKALARYTGAVLYVSHDSYFTGKLEGQTILLD